MVLIEGREFFMGTDAEDGKEGEGPTRLEKVKNFKINKYPITIASFRYSKHCLSYEVIGACCSRGEEGGVVLY